MKPEKKNVSERAVLCRESKKSNKNVFKVRKGDIILTQQGTVRYFSWISYKRSLLLLTCLKCLSLLVAV